MTRNSKFYFIVIEIILILIIGFFLINPHMFYNLYNNILDLKNDSFIYKTERELDEVKTLFSDKKMKQASIKIKQLEETLKEKYKINELRSLYYEIICLKAKLYYENGEIAKAKDILQKEISLYENNSNPILIEKIKSNLRIIKKSVSNKDYLKALNKCIEIENIINANIKEKEVNHQLQNLKRDLLELKVEIFGKTDNYGEYIKTEEIIGKKFDRNNQIITTDQINLIFYELAKIYYKNGEFKSAYRAIKKTFPVQDNVFNISFSRELLAGKIFTKVGKFEEAEKLIITFIKNTGLEENKFLLIEPYIHQGKYEKARKLIVEYSKQFPDDIWDLHLVYINLLERKFDIAEQDLEKIKSESNYRKLLESILFWNLGRKEEAVKFYSQIINQGIFNNKEKIKKFYHFKSHPEIIEIMINLIDECRSNHKK